MPGPLNARLAAGAAVACLLLAACRPSSGTAPAPGLSPGMTLPAPARQALARVELPPVAGRTGSVDIMAIDQSAHRLYAADHTDHGIDVVDVSGPAGRYLKTIPLSGDPNGVVVAEDLRLVFTGNVDATVSVIDVDPASPARDQVVATLETRGFGADELAYDPSRGKVFVASGKDGSVTVIDAAAKRIVAKLTQLGALQAPAYDPIDRLVYVAGVERNVIYRIDPTENRVSAAFRIPVSCGPHGIAINPTTHEGIIGCGTTEAPLVIGWDFRAGRALSIFHQTGAGDVALYDPRADRFFFAAVNLPDPQVAVFSGSPLAFLGAVATGPKSRSLAYDEAHGLVYTFDGKPKEGGLWSFPDPWR